MTLSFAQFSEAAEKNSQPILERLREVFSSKGTVLEIGSGSGQHAVCFSQALSHLKWQPSDRAVHLDSLVQNITNFGGGNVLVPVCLDVSALPWTVPAVDYLFAANVLHIMAETYVPDFFKGAAMVIAPGGRMCLYGPYRYENTFTSESNARFDDWLKSRDPASGIRDFEWVCKLATKNGFEFVSDYDMPANNQLLIFHKISVIHTV
ncbi:MAG: DUF938 domain-containing protein [Pseudomonadales bacterium]|nr:DUF938 domain-containing protein [Pseudomonadales bacterium]